MNTENSLGSCAVLGSGISSVKSWDCTAGRPVRESAKSVNSSFK